MGDDARILIVCTRNICQSPFIERLLQRHLDERAAAGARRDPRDSGRGIALRTSSPSPI